MQKIVKKPWGQEIILTEPALPYAAKILCLKIGARLSLQYHDQKTETLTLIHGQAKLVRGTSPSQLKTEIMLPQTGYTIKPNSIHRIEAATDCQIFEASTPEQGTTFRLEDDYGRPNENK